MERESVNLEREFKIAEKSYGSDHLDLVLTIGYFGKMIGNVWVVRYLAQHYGEILTEFQKLLERKQPRPDRTAYRAGRFDAAAEGIRTR
jgi:hypothetical protein